MTSCNGGGDNASLERLIHGFNRMFESCLRHEMEQRGIQEFFNPMILMALHRSAIEQVPLTQRRIASNLGISPPAVAVSIKRMERAGVVRKEADSQDQRRKIVTLTEKGRSLMDECVAGGREIYNRLIHGFTPEEMEILRGFYLRMIHNLRSCSPRPPRMIETSDLRQEYK